MKVRISLVLVVLLALRADATCLSGTYTIGGTNPSFPTINNAIDTLETNGVCGPVVFNIRPGVYVEQVRIDPIPGASSVNTVLIQSENGDSINTILKYLPTLANYNFTLWLRGADYITFKGLTITSSGGNYADVMRIDNISEHIVFTRNILRGFAAHITVSLFSSGAQDIQFIGNYFHQGSSAIHVFNSGDQDLLIAGNTFTDVKKSVFLSGVPDNTLIRNNFFTDAVVNCTEAIYCNNGSSLRIEKNKFQYSSLSDVIICNINGISGPLYILNNFVVAYSAAAFLVNQCTQPFICNNSVKIGNGSTRVGINLSANNNNPHIENNILDCATGAAVDFSGAPGFFCDNNVFNSQEYIFNGTPYTSFSQYVSLTGHDVNTLIHQTVFFSPSDLHCIDPLLNGIATSLSYVTDDIDGGPRSSLPDMGADEFSMVGVDDLAVESGQLLFFPNPLIANLSLECDLQSIDPDNSLFEIYDVLGNRCFAAVIGNDRHISIQREIFSGPGIYIVKAGFHSSILIVE
jgi:hypothetical protein